jgi:hypothetical protein
MTIVVGSVPEGDEFQPVYNEPLLVVLHVDPNKPVNEREWALYFGPQSRGEDDILKNGDKVNEEFARRLFPRLRGRYRV